MIVETDFATHWKTELLAEILKDPNAGMYLIRLWSHCQVRRCWMFNGDDLKGICRFKGDALVLQEALTIAKFVDPIDGGRLAVHEWEGYNAQLVASWNNGKRGGRKPSRNPAGTQGEPSRNPAGTQGEPSRNPAGTQGEPSRNPAGTQTNPSAGEEKRREEKILSLYLSHGSAGDQEMGDLRSEEGDEAHRIITSVPVLRCITWEDDLNARKYAEGLDFLKVAPEIAREAEMWKGDIGQPVLWLRKQYTTHRLKAESSVSEKKDGRPKSDRYVPMAERKG